VNERDLGDRLGIDRDIFRRGCGKYPWKVVTSEEISPSLESEQDAVSGVPPVPIGAPPVVVALLVHQPGPWFAETLASIAAQDYSRIQTIVFLTSVSPTEELTRQIRTTLPEAVIRVVEGNPGYGPVMNEVQRIVEGVGGFFCFIHDDVALRPDTVTKLIEETFRSNAGVVGPKLVQWDDPSQLQHVGLGADRIGEIDSLIEPYERDQEQHDAVRDVFFLPSACIVVRADLFRELGGFAPDIPFFGEDLEFCWRAHLSGARVLVVPAAVVRHRERFDERNPDIARPALEARHRVRTVATLSGRLQLPGVMVQLFITSLIETVVGIFTGGLRRSVATLRAAVAVLLDTRYILRRRGEVRPYRRIAAGEIHDLQVRGSARFTSFMRHRRAIAQQQMKENRKRGFRLRGGSRIIGVIAFAAVFVILIGSRDIIGSGVTSVGEFLPLRSGSGSPAKLLTNYLTNWTSVGFGHVGAQPTAHVFLALGGLLVFGKLALLQTLCVVGAIVIGCLGMASVGSVFQNSRARLVGAIVYAAIPLPYVSIAYGRLGALLCYAALPWMLHFFAMSSTAQSTNQRSQLFARAILLAGVTTAFVPSFALLVLLAGVLWLLGDVLAGTHRKQVLWSGLFAVVVAIGATIVQVPWLNSMVASDAWNWFTGSTTHTGNQLGLQNLAQLDFGSLRFGVAILALYLPVIAGLVIVKPERFVWAVRSATFVMGAGALAVIADQGRLSVTTPEPAIMLVVVACGLSLASATCVTAVTEDLRHDAFGWRQPIGWVVAVAILASIVPTLVNAADGRWHQPRVSLSQLLVQLPTDPPEGDFNTVFVGDPRVLQIPSTEINQEISYAVVDDGELTILDRWQSAQSPMTASMDRAMNAIISKSTSRGGRLLAPLAVRYIVIPLIDGGVSSYGRPLPVPNGLTEALSVQLDFRRVYSASDLMIFENMTWLPTLSVLDSETAVISSQGGDDILLSSSLRAASPLRFGSDFARLSLGVVDGGTVHLAVPFSENIRLNVGGAEVTPRVAFGGTTAFDLPVTGTAVLAYSTPVTHYVLVLVQLAMWCVLVAIAIDARRLRRRWRGGSQRINVSLREQG
jgi:GT2 family glycosyltransferase